MTEVMNNFKFNVTAKDAQEVSVMWATTENVLDVLDV
jgi:hypothetical protein